MKKEEVDRNNLSELNQAVEVLEKDLQKIIKTSWKRKNQSTNSIHS